MDRVGDFASRFGSASFGRAEFAGGAERIAVLI